MRRDEIDWQRIEQEYRVGQLTIKEIARQHGVTDSGIRKHAKADGWTRDLSRAVRARVRDSLVREGVRANQLAGVRPSDAAVVDEAAARGVELVRSHRYDIARLREAATGLLAYIDPQNDQELKITDRSRVISDLSAALARLIPLERQAFGLDEDRPEGSQPMTVVWEGMPAPAYD